VHAHTNETQQGCQIVFVAYGQNPDTKWPKSQNV